MRPAVFADGDNSQLAVVAMRCGEPVQGRQFLHAGRAPAGPQIDQYWYPAKVRERDLAAIGIAERRVRRVGALVAPVDALVRHARGLRLFLALSLRLRLRLRLGAAGEHCDRDGEDEKTHAAAASATGAERLVEGR